MAYRIPLGRVHQITSSGTPLSGALLYVYANTTTTPVALFTNYDGTGTAANPIVADSAGRFPFRYVAANSLVTLELKTSAGVSVFSDDNVAVEPADLSDVLLGSNNLSDVDSARAALDNLFSKGSDIASAATVNLATATGFAVDITGTTTITAFTLSAGDLRLVRFTGAGQVTYNASSLVIPGAANWTRANGDMALVYGTSTGVILIPWPISGGVVLDSAVKPTEAWLIAIGDETTAITTGTAKATFRAPYAFTITAVRASLTTASAASGPVTFDINESGTTILSTKLTIDDTEKTSTTAATAAVISDASIADDAEITIDIDDAGDGAATGAKVCLIGHRT